MKTMRIGLLFVFGLGLVGCPKNIPQPEIDAAEQAVEELNQTQDCAPEATMAARTTMDRAQALLKEERYDEAKTALLAAKKLAEKAKRECEKEKERRAEQERQRKLDAENAARTMEINKEPLKGPKSLATIHFDFNTSDLNDDARDALSANADYMQARPKERYQIEGHCDERGSTEYNLALGERRALAVKQYLVKLGIDPNRLEIISYGEERLVDTGQSEEAHKKNRRAEFRKLR